MPAIDDELAVARALVDLAQKLFSATAGDIETETPRTCVTDVVIMTEIPPSSGSPVDTVRRPRTARYRELAAVLTVVVMLALLILTVLLLADEPNRSDDAERAEHARRTVFTQWWSATYPDVSALQDVLDEAQRALNHREPLALASACQIMHDVAAVKVPAHLPAPDGDVGAQLAAAAEDAHSAAHMCLSVIEQTANNYDAEFLSSLEQAGRQVKVAMSTAGDYLAGTAHTSAPGA